MSKPIAAGSRVYVHTCHEGHVVADVTRMRPDGTVDLAFTYQGNPFVITSSPRDDSGEKFDSWHPLLAAGPQDEQAEPVASSEPDKAPLVPASPAAMQAAAVK